MQVVVNVLVTVFWGLLVLSLLVFFHEGGHYLASRACGVRVTEFYLGMPCRFKLYHKSRGHGTETGVTPLLLGGYTRICGMEGEEDELMAPVLALVTRRGRVKVADVASELGIDEGRAYGILATLVDWASVRPYYDPELGETPNQKDWPAAFESLERDGAGLTEYDRGHDFASVGSTAAGTPREVADADAFLAAERSRTYLGCSFLQRFFMLVAGPAVNIVLAFVMLTFAFMGHGFTYYPNVPEIGSVTEGSIAEASGLEAGDKITKVNDVEVTTWDELTDALDPYLEAGEGFTLTVERDSSDSVIVLDVDLPDGEKTELLGINLASSTYYPGFTEALGYSFSYAGQVASFAVQLIMPTHTMEVLEQTSSVVGISVTVSEAASSGIYELVLVAACVSMSLGFMNLLPIPPLDGGKILIEIIQLAIRRPLPQKVANGISYVGLAFFLFIFAFALRNDIVNLLA